ncbi:hypothetical protein CROQUDRAFT_94713 [Cronartium quercuum f. sp. fusiforme G11]|uniref:Uncharacterized protein n=1 Tax=Cronartium quercuum f. sp. fusiforme G11 TaxID=708437 RepID=A0A9P6TA17_9BASI|nr:hypothetical protein CROQUDRAFT_94713 [Cronartium quercuum f. sp. fusiforme G11]
MSLYVNHVLRPFWCTTPVGDISPPDGPAAPNPWVVIEEELCAIEGCFLAPTQPSPTTNPLTPCPSFPKMPWMQRVQDILGEANMGNIELIFKEIILRLKDLLMGGYDSLLTSIRTAPYTQKAPENFRCDKVTFKDAVSLAKYGHKLASQANPLDAVVSLALKKSV